MPQNLSISIDRECSNDLGEELTDENFNTNRYSSDNAMITDEKSIISSAELLPPGKLARRPNILLHLTQSAFNSESSDFRIVGVNRMAIIAQTNALPPKSVKIGEKNNVLEIPCKPNLFHLPRLLSLSNGDHSMLNPMLSRLIT